MQQISEKGVQTHLEAFALLRAASTLSVDGGVPVSFLVSFLELSCGDCFESETDSPGSGPALSSEDPGSSSLVSRS
jgi:hypothetical protein